MNELVINKIIDNALLEDMPYGDITTDNLIADNVMGEAILTSKEDGIVAGLDILVKIYKRVDKDIKIDLFYLDGAVIKKGDNIASIKGSVKSILKGERLALNILQHMSGIATLTNKFISLIKDLNTRIVDTRKTTPNLRILEKQAVLLGGGYNHRFNLSDTVMIKDNHIKAVGSIKEAVKIIKNKIPHTTKIEVEVTNLKELGEALETSVDIIMLDNMSTEMMREAVIINNKQCILEASGNVTLERVREIALTGVDVISVGALTHSSKSLDISLNIVQK